MITDYRYSHGFDSTSTTAIFVTKPPFLFLFYRQPPSFTSAIALLWSNYRTYTKLLYIKSFLPSRRIRSTQARKKHHRLQQNLTILAHALVATISLRAHQKILESHKPTSLTCRLL
ncbi:Bgt-20244 [Blumeria graminis f. sp. tritici]|uniref:Bgt-20244 n=2 Tax=Blumeria graminis f. sp. tritici TaxID=62690 RepID=A0A381L3B0_BLUGR|nr:Bgt-20244 [Blumeria graminis f. sp. tritici]